VSQILLLDNLGIESLGAKNIFRKVKNALNRHLTGYVSGHGYIDDAKLANLRSKVGSGDSSCTKIFESKFSKLVGSGDSVAFASGRMGFYVLMEVLGIGAGDEVILCGFICSVMPNAVLRIGAKPIYSDIDSTTFGSGVHAIEECLTSNTKLVVAQHSFGIPCDIDRILSLCKAKGIFLLEDCALALGSRLNDQNVGTFGDAAIFSTDHSKPINTISGGLIYSENSKITDKIRTIQKSCEHLPVNKEKALWLQFRVERAFAKPGVYGVLSLYNAVLGIINKKLGVPSPFLNGDTSDIIEDISYPYPSKLPAFAGLLGIYELERWKLVVRQRRDALDYYNTELLKSSLVKFVPKIYSDSSRYIIPLRFVFVYPQADKLRSKLKKLINVEETWFMKPIINSSVTLDKFLYQSGTCKSAELIGPMMINLPLGPPKSSTKIVQHILKNI